MLAYETHKALAVFPGFFIGPVQFGPYYLPSYLFTFWLGVGAIVLLGLREAKRKRIDTKELLRLYALMFASGIFFARFFYVLFFNEKGNALALFFDFTKSGLASSGAWFGIVLACILWGFWRRKGYWKLLDTASVGALLGQAIGRVGCFLAGCCYGAKTSSELWWAVFYKGAARHPAQLYDILNALIGFGVIWYLKDKKLFPGALLLLTIMLYSFGRVVVEFFRVGQHIWLFTVSQIFFACLFAGASAVFAMKARRSAQK